MRQDKLFTWLLSFLLHVYRCSLRCPQAVASLSLADVAGARAVQSDPSSTPELSGSSPGTSTAFGHGAISGAGFGAEGGPWVFNSLTWQREEVVTVAASAVPKGADVAQTIASGNGNTG